MASSTAFPAKMDHMSVTLMRQNEWYYISIQTSYRAPKRVRDDAPFGDDVARRRLLTIRGRTGAVLMIHPLQSESAEHVVEAMTNNFSEAQLQTIRHIRTDSPSEKLAKQLKLACPGLRSLMLDPSHCLRLWLLEQQKYWIQDAATHTSEMYCS